jgi:hypothetical protein
MAIYTEPLHNKRVQRGITRMNKETPMINATKVITLSLIFALVC